MKFNIYLTSKFDNDYRIKERALTCTLNGIKKILCK